MADIEQLRTSDSGVEVTQGVPTVMSRMPLVDLTALAPEKQQPVSQVTEGWKEKEGTAATAVPTATASIRDIIQRIHGTRILFLLAKEHFCINTCFT